ncbi:MAG: transporter substrate-binding domain-containing protein [Acidisphaera sp.]|nr:transporter substrate-binding domain-containing protein [Acidisphaera sp.]MBV9811507.1 transporter substrate-binding domain-containing protein [Acetobacteraceae bacterium]
MKRSLRFLSAAVALAGSHVARAGDLASGDTLRAVYLAGNPAQAMRDPASGEVRGASFDLAQALARRDGVALQFRPGGDPSSVIEAVRTGAADIGFVAYEATRLGTVAFSQPYMLVRQSFLVLEGSPLRSVADIDRAGQTIGGTRNDSITLCMQRTFRRAKVVEVPNTPAELGAALTRRSVDAIGANRQRLTALMRLTQGTRLLPDDLFSVPQNVVVAQDRPAALATVNATIDALRASGAMQAAIERGGAVGVAVAPAGATAGCPQD